MVKIAAFVVSFPILFTSISAAPLQKRIAQIIADSTRDWEQACLKAGGGAKCNTVSQTAFTSLLAAGKNCDQQDAADQMVDLARSLNNDPEMIRFAQLFVQQPRNAPDSLQVPYCQQAPRNAELNGLFHCQFAGSNFAKFSGDQTGNLPLGVSAVNPPGSCPAKLDGPVPDGAQLNTLVKEPRASGSAATPSASPSQGSPSASPSNGNASSAPAPAPQTSPVATPSASPSQGNQSISPSTSPSNGDAASSVAPAPAPQTSPIAQAPSSNTGFALQNGKDAKTLNAKFAALSANSACNDGEQACVNGGFAQCIGGKFSITQCTSGTICAALPLVNKPGTSLACTTQADVDARIAATGA